MDRATKRRNKRKEIIKRICLNLKVSLQPAPRIVHERARRPDIGTIEFPINILDRTPKRILARIEMGHQGAPYLVVPPGKRDSPSDVPELLSKAFRATEEAIASEFESPHCSCAKGEVFL